MAEPRQAEGRQGPEAWVLLPTFGRDPIGPPLPPPHPISLLIPVWKVEGTSRDLNLPQPPSI